MSRSSQLAVTLFVAIAAAGVWSSLHQLVSVRQQWHDHETLLAALAPHHLISIAASLVPVFSLLAGVLHAKRQCGSWLPRIRSNHLVGAILILEIAELGSGSMSHGWVTTTILIAASLAFSWLLAKLAVTVARVVLSRRRPLTARSAGLAQADDASAVSIDVLHPSRIWLARRSRRGPPLTLAAA